MRQSRGAFGWGAAAFCNCQERACPVHNGRRRRLSAGAEAPGAAPRGHRCSSAGARGLRATKNAEIPVSKGVTRQCSVWACDVSAGLREALARRELPHRATRARPCRRATLVKQAMLLGVSARLTPAAQSGNGGRRGRPKPDRQGRRPLLVEILRVAQRF
jgi:hypothetical protein